MNDESAFEVRASGPSPAERDWRNALRAAGYQVAPTNIRVHPSQLNNPAADKRAAEEAYRRFVAAEPENLMGLDGLAFLLQHRGASSEAMQVRRQRYAAESRLLGVPEEEIPAVVDFLAASLGDGVAPDAAPAAYVEKMFDDAAETFDERLVKGLGYRGPELLWEAIGPAIRGGAGDLEVLDLGCGTGLMGVVLRPVARRLTGVDLSPEMLKRAERRGVYDELLQTEIIGFLVSTDQRYSLIVAAEVLNYFGDVRAVFAAVAQSLRPGGIWATTAERGEDVDFRLRGMRRYQHTRAHLEDAAVAAGLTAVVLDDVELRREQGEPVWAWRGLWRSEL